MHPTGRVSQSERSIRVDLSAIRHNISVFCGWAAPSSVMAVVKADGYGHGAVPVARAAIEGGASWIGVAHISEALTLRTAGITTPLLTWLHTPRSDFLAAVSCDIRIAVSSPPELNRVAEAAATSGKRATVHLKIDTGLGRNGAAPDTWAEILSEAVLLQRHGAIDVEGVMSHLSVAETATRDPETDHQKRVFENAVSAARSLGLDIRVAHLANTAAALRRPDLHFDLVRVGIGTYGLSPLGSSEWNPLSLRRALTLTSVLSTVKVLPDGHGVSYGARHITSKPTRVGLVPVGYGDGLPREARGMRVMIRDIPYPILGVIAMDQLVIDLGDAAADAAASPQSGDEVVIISHDRVNTADDWAAGSNTINYEIVTRLTGRPDRIYV